MNFAVSLLAFFFAGSFYQLKRLVNWQTFHK